jgi:ribonuclease HII
VWEKVLVFPQEIDEKGVWTSVIQAHNCVHQALAKRVEGTVLHIVDGLENAKRLLMPGLVPLSKADVYIPAVSLASCFAKTIQCVLMDKAEKDFPGYGFGTHRGYGTPQHKAALETLGICPIHRKSYGPVKSLLQQTDPNLWESGSDLTSERSIL